jgi:hypothetical protein
MRGAVTGSSSVLKAPIFVVGVGRSGTSLLQSMLAAHSQVAVPPETGFVRRYVAARRLAREYRRGGMQRVRAILRADERVARLGLEVDRLIDWQGLARSDEKDAHVYQVLMQAYARKIGKSRVGDKDTRLVEYLPVLRYFWPDAHIVHVIRDPRDVMASRKRAEWSKKRPYVVHLFAQKTQFALGCRFGRQYFGKRYHEIRYEELLGLPWEALTNLCGDVGLTFERQMLQFGDAARRLVTEAEYSWKKETLGPLLKSNTGKWQGQLTPLEILMAEMVCEDTFDVGGYMTRPGIEDVSLAARSAARVAYGTLRALGTLYERYRVWRLAEFSGRNGDAELGF